MKPATWRPILNLQDSDIDTRWPIEVVSTGLPFVIVPLKSLDAIKRARVNSDALESIISDPQQTREIMLFTPETYSPDCQLNVRVFVPLLGIPEDPATGSANSCLAGYLSKHQVFGQFNRGYPGRARHGDQPPVQTVSQGRVG